MSAFEFRKTHYKRIWIFWKKEYYTYKGGHAWALDGFRIMKRKVEKIDSNDRVISSRYEQIQLVHCNMGWYGDSNGYYNNGIFDTNKGPFARSTEGTEYYFKYNMQMVKNIK